MSDLTGYIAPEGFEAELATELSRQGVSVRETHGRLMLAEGAAVRPAWAQNIWYEVQELPVPSIKQAARSLKAIQRNWALLPTGPYRRAQLIAEHLPHVSAKPLTFPDPPPSAPLGGWTLTAPDRMLAAARTASPFAHGEPQFVEDKDGPPSRAYLKLWEAFTVLGCAPTAGDVCLDLGAAPGGWTWVLAQLGAEVHALDKAPLAPHVEAMANVTYTRESAFGLRPQHVGPVDWLLSDVICYPSKLLDLVRRWLDAGLVRNAVCTIKFQGETDFETMDAFAAIPGSRLMHLNANKHELTWVRLDPAGERA